MNKTHIKIIVMCKVLVKKFLDMSWTLFYNLVSYFIIIRECNILKSGIKVFDRLAKISNQSNQFNNN